MFPVLLVWAKDRLPMCSAPLMSSGLLSIPSPVLDIFQCLSPVLPLFVSTSGLVYLEILSCLFLGLAVNIRPVLFTCFLLSLCFYLPGAAYLWVWSCLPPVVCSSLYLSDLCFCQPLVHTCVSSLVVSRACSLTGDDHWVSSPTGSCNSILQGKQTF